MNPVLILRVTLSGMWHGYRRWMSLFNALSIVLSVTLAFLILGFAHGVRSYVDETVRTEAAAGALRVHQGGWRTEEAAVTFRDQLRHVETALRDRFGHRFQGLYPWWRSEAHFLMLDHPADSDTRGIYSQLGNTFVGDPEADRVRTFAVAGGWITDDEADQIVLSAEAAVKLAKRLPDTDSAAALVGRWIWITLPGTSDHLPAACARVRVAGIFDHLRDQACLTTPAVIRDMTARTQAQANARWYETYGRMAYDVDLLRGGDGVTVALNPPVPLICWRVRDAASRWILLGGPIADIAPLDDGDAPLALEALPRGLAETASIAAPPRAVPPPSERMTLPALVETHPAGFVLCSPRVWDELGFAVAPHYPVEPWETSALYAYLYLRDLDAAREARSLAEARGLETYMPIDRFQGLLSLVGLISGVAAGLLAVVLGAGLLGIGITLFTEVDAEESEIGLLKALGASNLLIGAVFVSKGAVVGVAGIAVGVPLALWIGGAVNATLAGVVARVGGVADASALLVDPNPWMLAAASAGVVAAAAAAALVPAWQAARKDPQEALRAE